MAFLMEKNKRSTETYTYKIKSQVSVEQTRNQYILLCWVSSIFCLQRIYRLWPLKSPIHLGLYRLVTVQHSNNCDILSRCSSDWWKELMFNFSPYSCSHRSLLWDTIFQSNIPTYNSHLEISKPALDLVLPQNIVIQGTRFWNRQDKTSLIS